VNKHLLVEFVMDHPVSELQDIKLRNQTAKCKQPFKDT